MKISIWISVVTTVILLSCGSENKTPVPSIATAESKEKEKEATRADVLKFIKHEVTDYQGTGKVAMTYILPENWKAEDSLFWLTADPNVPIRFAATYTSGNNLSKIETYPDIRLVWSSGPMGIQGQAPPTSILNGLNKVIEFTRPGIKTKVIDQKLIPDIDPPSLNQGGVRGQSHSERGMVKIEYEVNGQVFEDEFYGLYITNTVTTEGMAPSKTVGWNLTDLFSVSAPKGKLEDCKKIALTTRSSLRVTKSFFNRFYQVVQLLQNQYYQRIYQAGEISKVISATNDQMLAAIDAQYQNVQKSQDKINQNFSDYMRGVERYNNGNGSTVQLPSGYQNVWVNERGEYVMSNTPGFDPSVYYKENWKSLQRVK